VAPAISPPNPVEEVPDLPFDTSPPDINCEGEEHYNGEHPSDYDSSSSSSSGSSSSSLGPDDRVDIVPQFPSSMGDNGFSHVQNFRLVKHRQTHRLHFLVNDEHTRLICGRALSQTYERLDQFPSHPLPTCVQCFASKLVGSYDEF
jgi:hypothetical protein